MSPEEIEKEKDIAKIQAITDRINATDADDPDGYLTTDESKLIKDLAQKHKLTADDLKKIGGRVFEDYYGYGTDKFAYKEPESATNKLKEERDKLWDKFPNATKSEIKRLIELRDLLGDDEFYEGK